MLTYTYTYTGVPVGTTEFIIIQSLHGDTRRYNRNYISTSYLILVLQSLFWYFGSYLSITEHIHVFKILYMYYRTYTFISDLKCILRNLYFIQDLFFCEGTRRYDESEQIRIIAHTRSDQTYADTYQVWTLVHSRYRS